MPILKILLGVSLGILSIIGVVLNFIVLIPVFKFAFLQNKSPIYALSFINIILDIVNLLLTVFYLVPSIISNSYFFTDQKSGILSILMGTCFMFLWYLGSITQIVMAVNRLVVIYFRRSDVFTRYNIGLLFSGIVPACLFLAYMAQYGFVCCSFIFDHVVLSYSYNHIGDLENYPNIFIDLPLNTFSSTCALICYLIIVWTVRKSTRGIASTTQRPQKNREVVYAMQFCVISILYTFSWITFRLFPVLIGNSRPEWFIFISIAVTVNNSANAIIYLISNQEVIRNLKSSGLFTKARNSQTLAIT